MAYLALFMYMIFCIPALNKKVIKHSTLSYPREMEGSRCGLISEHSAVFRNAIYVT